MLRRSLLLTAAVLALGLFLAACGDDEEEDTAADTAPTEEATTTDAGGGGGAAGGAEKITVSETEFALDPPNATVPAGPVTIEATNDGQIVHNLEVEGDGVEEITADLQPGDSDTLQLDLEPGTYTWYCAIGNHAEQGMEGELTVE